MKKSRSGFHARFARSNAASAASVPFGPTDRRCPRGRCFGPRCHPHYFPRRPLFGPTECTSAIIPLWDDERPARSLTQPCIVGRPIYFTLSSESWKRTLSERFCGSTLLLPVRLADLLFEPLRVVSLTFQVERSSGNRQAAFHEQRSAHHTRNALEH